MSETPAFDEGSVSRHQRKRGELQLQSDPTRAASSMLTCGVVRPRDGVGMESDTGIAVSGAESPATSSHTARSLLSGTHPVRIRSFGPLNPDKVFYVIYRQKGPGFFSILTSTLCHLDIADRLGFVPVVDMEHFESHYNEDHPIGGTRNSWEYYFRPVSPYSLDEVYQSRRVVFCDGGYPAGYPFWLTEAPELQAAYRKHISIDPGILDFVDRFEERELAGSSVLGVHFRGQEYRLAPDHPFPPTPRQMIARAQALLAEGAYEKVFVVTEEQSYLDLFKRTFGNRVVCTEAYRTYETNAYGIYPRLDHSYLLGRDVLRDTLILARCNALLCSGSNVSEFAQFYNCGRYDVVSKVDNGVNVSNGVVAKGLWFVKSWLPQHLGGFPVE